MLGDAVAAVIALGLDSPDLTICVLGDQINAAVCAPTAWLVVPMPDFFKAQGIMRIIL